MFDGATFDPARDGKRLTRQFYKVKTLMRDGKWRTLARIAQAVSGSEAGVSARLRDFRKERFGSWTVERRRVEGRPGLWEYRVVPGSGATDPLLDAAWAAGAMPQVQDVKLSKNGERGVMNVLSNLKKLVDSK